MSPFVVAVVKTRKYGKSNCPGRQSVYSSKHWKESHTRQSLQSLSLFSFVLSFLAYEIIESPCASLSHNVACLWISLWPVTLIFSDFSVTFFDNTNTMRKRCSKELQYRQKRAVCGENSKNTSLRDIFFLLEDSALSFFHVFSLFFSATALGPARTARMSTDVHRSKREHTRSNSLKLVRTRATLTR